MKIVQHYSTGLPPSNFIDAKSPRSTMSQADLADGFIIQTAIIQQHIR